MVFGKKTPSAVSAGVARGAAKTPAKEKASREHRAPKPDRGASGAAGQSRVLRLANWSGRWVVLVVVLAATTLLVATNLFYRPVVHQVGERVESDIRASVSFSVVDEVEQQKAIEEKKSQSKQYYRFVPRIQDDVRGRIDALFQEARRVAAGRPGADGKGAAKEITRWAETQHRITLDAALAEELISKRDAPDLPLAWNKALDAVYSGRGVVDDLKVYRLYHEKGLVLFANPPGISENPQFMRDFSGIGSFLREQLASGGDLAVLVPSEHRGFIGRLVEAYARPNVLYMLDKTNEEREKEIKSLQVKRKDFERGTILVRKDRVITPQDLELLASMQRTHARTLYLKFLAIALYIILLAALACYYLRVFRSDVHFTTGNVLLVALPVLIALGIGRVALEVVHLRNLPEAAGYAFPAGIIGMLTVILLDSRSGILLVTIGSLAFSIATGLDFKVFLTSLLGGYAAVAVLKSAQERKEVLKAGLVVGVVNAVVILLVNFIDDPTRLRDNFSLTFWGLGNGLMSGVISMPALVLFESSFGVVTDIRLLELTGLDHPLLKELEEKAPGSYQHSLNVCKLAEAAARAIGANYLLVRAGAYYHDVGKVLKPQYFGENQITLEEKSLHGKISPYMSAMIIKNHVKGGIDLARQHHLPEKVVDFIPQHQGTTIITYFYHGALKRFEDSQSTDPVREIDFRYPGPKPQSIEPAIVMLADAVEATVTSRFTSVTINEDELVMCVKKTVADKFADGQFDECDLTLRDLHQIRESFIKTLLGRFHQRIAYPSAPGLSGPAAPTSKRDRLDREAPEHGRPKANGQVVHAGR